MKIGKNISEIRQMHGIAPDFMASRLKISLEEYYDIENDKVDITISCLESIAKILMVKPIDLFSFDEPTSGIRNYFINHNGNNGININNQGVDQQEIRKAFKELYIDELERIPKLEKLLRENNIQYQF